MVNCLGETGSKVGVDGTEDGEGTLLDLGRLDIPEVTSNVADKALASSIVEDLGPESVGLLEVELGNGRKVGDGGSGELLVGDGRVARLLVLEGLDRRLVVGGVALIVEGSGSVTLEVAGGVERSIDGQLSVVGSETVAVSVGVGEETGLEDRVGGGLDSGNKVRRREGDLLNLGEVVGLVLVERELADGAERVLRDREAISCDPDSIESPPLTSLCGQILVKSRMLCSNFSACSGVMVCTQRVQLGNSLRSIASNRSWPAKSGFSPASLTDSSWVKVLRGWSHW